MPHSAINEEAQLSSPHLKAPFLHTLHTLFTHKNTFIFHGFSSRLHGSQYPQIIPPLPLNSRVHQKTHLQSPHNIRPRRLPRTRITVPSPTRRRDPAVFGVRCDNPGDIAGCEVLRDSRPAGELRGLSLRVRFRRRDQDVGELPTRVPPELCGPLDGS